MSKNIKYYITTAIGILLLAAGLYLVKTVADPSGILLTLPYVLIGVGSGAFGGGMGEIIKIRSLKNHPEIEKNIEIEKNDERNIAIANRAKAKAYDMMIFVIGALLLAFALMGVDISQVLLLVCAYLFIIGYSVYYRIKYDKEM